MAAPMEDSDSTNQNQIDFFSSNFDPLCALYSNTDVPCPHVKIFNNVAEYESNMKGPNRKHIIRPSQNTSIATTTTTTTSTTSNIAASTSRINNPAVEHTLEMPNENMHAARRRMLRNVLTRMDQSFISGPLSILRRCVQEKLKVHVWTRSARSIRGVLKGYIIAFDKHFNIAMIDVDEVYKDPSARRKRKQRTATEYENTTQEKTCNVETQINLNTSSSEDKLHPPVQSRLSLPQSDRTLSHVRSMFASATDSKTAGSDRTFVKGVSLPYEAAWLGLRSEFIAQRHVNQLFVRGDNVVCVNLAGAPK